MSLVGTVAEIWRYPVKSMGGERLAQSATATRGLHADRMWAVRDVELNTFTTARRWPVLLQCSARFMEDPAGRSAGPGDVLEVIVTFPDGTEVSSSNPAINDHLSELIGKPARLESLPALSEKQLYRTPQATKADMRRQFAIPDGEPLPDFSMFPVRKLAELARYATPVGALYDAYPILLMTRASLRAMAERSPGSQFDVRRFRPNVVIDRDGAELVEFGWCGGRVRAPNVAFDAEIPALRCSIPTRQQGDNLRADPDVLRTINAHADHCLGVYANVAAAGTLAEGDPLELGPSAAASAPAAVARSGATALKRRALRVFEALMCGSAEPRYWQMPSRRLSRRMPRCRDLAAGPSAGTAKAGQRFRQVETGGRPRLVHRPVTRRTRAEGRSPSARTSAPFRAQSGTVHVRATHRPSSRGFTS